jgi:putative two-component system response regulator
MFSLLEKITPDLILLDIEMPETNGFNAIKILKECDSCSEIPVIFLTGKVDSVIEALCIELGAVDFITKPFSQPVLLNRIKNHLQIDEQIRQRTEQLRERTKRLVQLQNGIVFTMADLVENRDKNTGGHIERTTMDIKILIDAMIERRVYYDEMQTWDIGLVVSSARLHDVGKIAISDTILNKPGPLTADEFSIMKTHAAEGEKIIDKTVSRTGEADFLRYAKLAAAYHHERWDGTGYPHGLKETDIPLLGRVVSIVDVYDALVTERPYKKPMPEDEAVRVIMENKDRQFDPLVADTFFEVKDRFAEVAWNFNGPGGKDNNQ